MAFPIPLGCAAEELGQANDLTRLSRLAGLEEAQAEGTRMLWAFSFGWRFPLFESLAGDLNWALKQAGVTPWPEYTDLVFVDAAEPVWYIAWVRGLAWLLPIITALAPVIAVIVAVFLGSVLYRVLPQEVKQPIETILSFLPLMVLVLVFSFIPQLTRMLSPPKEG